MRAWATHEGLSVRVTAGTNTVLIGLDLDDPAGCLGFGIHRTDHTEGESAWLRGMKSFASVVPHPTAGMDFSTRQQPIQGFLWGDYTAKPEHHYTYKVAALGGTPGHLTVLRDVSADVHTEAEDDGEHGIWFNRGVAGSQAFVKRFGSFTPPVGAAEDHPAFGWLSRGLGEAFVRFVQRADGPDWGLRGAFYEFTWQTGLRALAAAAQSGADVSLVVHGRDKDAAGKDADHTAADNRAAATAAGLPEDVVIWRTAGNKSALQHNKFLVLTHHGEPVAVWTGSTNLTQGAVFGHLNVGHSITGTQIAGQFLAYWTALADQGNTTAVMRTWTETSNPVDLGQPPPDDLTTILSPRATTSTLLSWYADAFDAAMNSAHITGAFGLNKVFREKLGAGRDIVRTVLLDQRPGPGQEIPHTDPDVRTSWGNYLEHTVFEQWAAEKLTNFNSWVKFIHTKIILVDPLTRSPSTFTGSANYSDNSTTDNEENTVVIRPAGPGAQASAAAQRVADIYITEYQRLFMHFIFRDWAVSTPAEAAQKLRLVEDETWSRPHYLPGGWRARQRSTFAAPIS